MQRRPARHRRGWTDAEVQQLRELAYGEASKRGIARILGRSAESVLTSTTTRVAPRKDAAFRVSFA